MKDSVKYYFYSIVDKVGIIEFLNMVLDNNVEKMENISKLEEYGEEFTKKEIDKGIEQITKNNSKTILTNIINKIDIENNVNMINDILKKYLQEMDEFSLEFNVNSNSEGEKELYRNIQKLSLGQKVVAMLTFILSYSDFSDDYTPLIIDQPEDNLDSQYIYNYLVEELVVSNQRKIKKKKAINQDLLL